VRQEIPLIPVAQEVQRRGYHVEQSGLLEPNDWEKSTFRMRSKKWFSFRADQPLPNVRNTYCRFRLIEETYDSGADAQDRLTRIHLPDPSEEQMYTPGLRTGFRVGNVAYVFQTDGAIFLDEIKRLAKELAPRSG